MNDPFQTKGTLTVSLGEGYLSAFEVSALKPGDVVRTSRTAGMSYAVLYNGLPLAQCEAVILGAPGGGSVFGARISDTDFPIAFACGPVRKDEIGELLPFLVSLGSIQVSLAELDGVGANSLIGLGKPWSVETEADLLVAGFPVASGRVVVIGEEMGLRITRLIASPSGVAAVASSGFLLDRQTAATVQVKDYDFRRPDKFALQQILRLRDIHALFLQNLRARLPALGELIQTDPHPARVDQCTLGEAADDLTAHGLANRLVLENLPWRRAPRDGADRTASARSSWLLVEEKGTAHPVDPRVRAFFEEYLKAEGLVNRNAIFLFHGDDAEVCRAVADERDALLACLRGGWRNLVDLNLASVPPEEAARVSAISPNEMVILVTFASREDGRPILALVYPYLTLEPFVRLLQH